MTERISSVMGATDAEDDSPFRPSAIGRTVESPPSTRPSPVERVGRELGARGSGDAAVGGGGDALARLTAEVETFGLGEPYDYLSLGDEAREEAQAAEERAEARARSSAARAAARQAVGGAEPVDAGT